MKDPAFLFYYQDWLVGTYFLKRREKGAYMDLLCYQADKGVLTIDTIKEILNGDFDCWDKLKEKFIEEEGIFYNKRLKAEKEKRENFTKSRRSNLSHMKPHMENENENEDLIEKEEKFKREVFTFLNVYPETMLKAFCNYWTEPNKSKTKMRFEQEPTWEIKRRLNTWASRDKEFIKTSAQTPDLISYKELADRFSKGETSIWDKYEPVTPGDKRTMWKRK